MMTTTTSGFTPKRFEVGEPYRQSSLRPATIVVRQTSHSANALSSGSPCCMRTVTLRHAAITYMQQQWHKHGQVRPGEIRRCPGCHCKYLILVDSDKPAGRIATVEWIVQP